METARKAVSFVVCAEGANNPEQARLKAERIEGFLRAKSNLLHYTHLNAS